MKKITQFKIGLLLSISALSAPLFARDATAAQLQNINVGTTAINSFVLDKANGDVYAGTAATNTTSSLIKITRNADGTAPTVTAIAPATTNLNGTAASANPLTASIIRLMALSMSGTTPRIVAVNGTNNRTHLHVSNASGTTVGVSSITSTGAATALVDSAGAALANDGIIAITAGSTLAFSAVAASAGTNWAAINRGICITSIDATTLAPVFTNAGTMAVPGTAANSCINVAATVVDTQGSSFGIVNTATITANSIPSLWFEEDIARLYIGSQVTTAGAGTDQATSVLIYGAPTAATAFAPLQTVGAAAAFNTVTTNPIAAFGAAQLVNALNIAVITTPRGYKYLIVNGGNGALNACANQVYSIPLVSGIGVSGNTLGTFAKNASIGNPDFTVQASASGDLGLSTRTDMIVGSVVAPIAQNQGLTTAITSILKVVGDTVYIASAAADGAADGSESGIFYSRPEYNQNGAIQRWTRWTRAVPAIMGASSTDGSVAQFEVDAKTNKVWSVPRGTLTTAYVSAYGAEAGTNALATLVNAQLSDGCFSVFNLDRTNVNWGNNAGARYAIFGGFEKVVFARTSIATGDPAGVFTHTDTQNGADFSGAAVFRTFTTGLSGTGSVTALGVICPGADANESFFLAGTQKGLYALAKSAGTVGQGGTADFTVAVADNLDTLDATVALSFFATEKLPTWQQIAKVSGQVTKIAASSTAVFILARDTGTDGTIQDTLWMYPHANTNTTVTLVNTALLSIAVSGVAATNSDLSKASQINDFVVINGIAAGTDCQVILATNNGLYQSKTATGVEAATTQATALWSQIKDKAGNYSSNADYNRLFTNSTTNLNCSFNAFSYKDSSSNLLSYQYGTVDQLFASDDDLNGNTIIFGNNNNSNSTSSFLHLNRMLNYWSDGARRFFIGSAVDGSSTLQVLPYNVSLWNVTDPVTPVTSTQLGDVSRVYCASLIPNGYIAIGTDKGIVLL